MHRRRNGISIVETLVVMGIILILLSMLLTTIGGAIKAVRSLRGQARPPGIVYTT